MILSPRTDGVDINTEYRDEFTSLNPSNWEAPVTSGSVVYGIEGNAAGSSYLRVALDPRDPSASFDMVGANSLCVTHPFRVGFGITTSRRSLQTHMWFGLVGVDSSTKKAALNPSADYVAGTSVAKLLPSITFSSGITVLSNVATITTDTPHGLNVGDRIVINGVLDPRLNVCTVVIGLGAANNVFSYTQTFSNGTYGTTGTITKWRANLGYRDTIGCLFRDNVIGNVDFVNSSAGGSTYSHLWNPGSSFDIAVVPNDIINYQASYTYPLTPKTTVQFAHEGDWISGQVALTDYTGNPSSMYSRDQNIPTPSGGFVPRVKVTNLPNLSVPVGPITVASRSGSTVATLTVPNHGLGPNDLVAIYGIRDQTNFTNQVTAINITSVVDSNTITVTFGASATATSYGGCVYRINASAIPYYGTSSIQQIAPLSGRTAVTFAASQGTLNPGETVLLCGIVDNTNTNLAQYEGLYRVATSSTSTFITELEPLQGQPIPGSTITCGGMYVGCAEFRLHFIRGISHSRVGVEVTSSVGHTRSQNSVPVIFNNSPAVSVNTICGYAVALLLNQAGTSRYQVTAGMAPTNVLDKSTGVINSNSNAGTIAADAGCTGVFMLNVSGVSGTSPTFDITLQQSYDNGTTWHDYYVMPRITTNGTYKTPALVIAGRRRWAWVVAGSGATCTLVISGMVSDAPVDIVHQAIDRSIVSDTLNSASATRFVDCCTKFSLFVSSNAGATVAPVYGLQCSPDGNDWADMGLSITVPASSNVVGSITTEFPATYVRAYIKTAGTGSSHKYCVLTAK